MSKDKEEVKEETCQFYMNDTDYVFRRLQSRPEGLTLVEAVRRREVLGGKLNELSGDPEKPLFLQFLEKFTDPMIVLLLVSACISLVMKQFDDALSIILAVTIVSIVGFVQEYKSEQSVSALKELIAHHCVVVRDGKPIDIPAVDLVPGDVVQLAAGVCVPADLRIFEAHNLIVNESLLTGESEPTAKCTEPVDREKGLILADRNNMAFMGTAVAAGTGMGVVTAIGDDTEIGAISQDLQDTEKKTPLQYSMDQLAKKLSLWSTIAIAIICIIGFIQGKPALQMFNMAVSLIVAAIPEGLPIAVTVTLALGVNRMAKKNAIVRKLPAVEALGATNVICVDKTGTLTQNQMTVVRYYTDRHIKVTHHDDSLVSGGVELTDAETESAVSLDRDRHLEKLLRATVLCNNAEIDRSSGTSIGQPTEAGLLSAAVKCGVKDARQSVRRITEIPFDSKTKWMGVQVSESPSPVYYVKGAVEVVLGNCSSSFSGSLNRNEVISAMHKMASQALRVIAVAYGPNPDHDLVFLGLVGLRDPPRSGVKEAVAKCHQSHVRVVMITGDSRETAVAVAKEIGIVTAGDDEEVEALSAADLDKMDPDHNMDDQEKIFRTSVFYRMTPAHKVTVVTAHRAHGNEVVAMTGDGVNDAPALSKSDIGIAMGRGSDVAKEASEIILVDNNFSTIVHAIDEGKVIFEAIQNFLHFQLTTSIAAMVLIASCSLLDLPLPLNATQILLINIIMDGPPAQSLTFEEYRDKTDKPPRNPKDPITPMFMRVKIVISSIIMVVGTILAFLVVLPKNELDISVLNNMNEAPELASTMAFTTFVLFQLFNALNCRSYTKSVFTVGLFSNKPFIYSSIGTIAAQLLVVYVKPFQLIFGTTALTLSQVGICVGIASSVLVADEFVKLVRFYK